LNSSDFSKLSVPERSPDNNKCMRVLVTNLSAILLIASTGVPSALASLGGAESTVEVDRAHIGATHRLLADPRFTLHELQVPSGATVREYVSPTTGTVFGVAWQGPSMPDLRQLLGSHFDQYVSAMAARRSRGPVVIQLPGLVVQSSGRMRAFTGRAYLPEALPPGVRAEDIR
jgi:hypothetical protein